ncbi:MAG: hypothetical protein SV062_06945, partial [Thermodesulfobacteriota bacterium]|nr:hypothetical protein [Thermodesulfobacteriota bacterium]
TMITNLLWRCPLCKTEDSLSYKKSLFKPDIMTCNTCHTVWEFVKTDKEDFYWKIVKGEQKGLELRLAEWYRKMKEGFKPLPRKTAEVELLPEEEVYLVSKSDRIKLITQKTNPLFFGWDKQEFPFEKQGKHSPYMKSFGPGQLFLSSHRFVWKTRENLYFFLTDRIISIYGEAGFYLGLFYGSTKYKFRFKKDSLVKWLTYAGYVAEKTRMRNDHKILISNY